MILKVEIANQKVCIRDEAGSICSGMTNIFTKLSDIYAENPKLLVQVDAREPKIMVQRYVGKKISEVQLNYLIKIISDRTERRAHIKIMCQWLQENSIPWEKLK